MAGHQDRIRIKMSTLAEPLPSNHHGLTCCSSSAVIDYYKTSNCRTLSLRELKTLCERHMISEEDAGGIRDPEEDESGEMRDASMPVIALEQVNEKSALAGGASEAPDAGGIRDPEEDESGEMRDPSMPVIAVVEVNQSPAILATQVNQEPAQAGGAGEARDSSLWQFIRSLSGDDEPATLTLIANDANDQSDHPQHLREFDERLIVVTAPSRICARRATESGGGPMGAEDDGADASEPSTSFSASFGNMCGCVTDVGGSGVDDWENDVNDVEQAADKPRDVSVVETKSDDSNEEGTKATVVGENDVNDVQQATNEPRDGSDVGTKSDGSNGEGTKATPPPEVICIGDGVAKVCASAMSEPLVFGHRREPGLWGAAKLAHSRRTWGKKTPSSKQGQTGAVVDHADFSCGFFPKEYSLVAGQRLVHVGDDRGDLWPRSRKDVLRWVKSASSDHDDTSTPVRCTFSALAWQDHMWILMIFFQDHVWNTQGKFARRILEKRTPLKVALRTLRCLGMLAVVLVLLWLLVIVASVALFGAACGQFFKMIFNRFVSRGAYPRLSWRPRIDPCRAPCQRIYPSLVRERWPGLDNSWLPEDPESLRENRRCVQGVHGYRGAGERVPCEEFMAIGDCYGLGGGGSYR